MSISKKYLFIGGPWHGRTEFAKGYDLIEVPEVIKTPTVEVANDVFLSSFSTWTKHTYRLRKFTFGEGRIVEVYAGGPEAEFGVLFADFMTAIFNMYVEA